jgi:hypothetical protein
LNNHIARLLFGLLFFSCSAEVNFLPDEFFDLSLTKKLNGEEAKEFVNKLHFESVTETENEIGFYEGDGGTALIYITHYNIKETVEVDYKLMTEKISPENSVFIGSEYLMLKEKEVFRCFGMGQSHYVFYLGRELFWISVDTHFGKKFVQRYIEFLSG